MHVNCMYVHLKKQNFSIQNPQSNASTHTYLHATTITYYLCICSTYNYYYAIICIACYSVLNGSACPITYQAVLVVTRFTGAHSGT